MSQITHRKRLREARQRAESRNLQAFSPAGNVGRIAAPAPAAAMPPAATVEPVAFDAVSAEDVQPHVVQPDQQPVATRAVVPVDIATRGMTVEQLRSHAKGTAEMLAALPQDQYAATLESLEANNPQLYSVVVDELNNMAAQTGGDDDGFDLSGLASGEATSPISQPEVVGATPDPNVQSDAQ